MTTYKPKLIEVALPLAAINAAAGAEGSTGQRPHPKNLHRWWARRPLAAARAVLWASLVDDPSGDESMTDEEQETERTRLFRILERLVQWDGAQDQDVLREARAEIDRCFPDGTPVIADPFGGGGAIPLEAQRLNLSTVAGDLNPVSVLIQKAMVEIPPRFVGRSPVNSTAGKDESLVWERVHGLAADVQAYGEWICAEARSRIGELYPDPSAENGEKVTPIAWIWARTIESPDPAWNGHVPLVASWELAKKKGKPIVWIEPIVDPETKSIDYHVRFGGRPSHEKTVDRGGGRCIATGSTMPFSYIRAEFQAGRVGQHLLAVVADGSSGRMYLSPGAEQTSAANINRPENVIEGAIFDWPGRTNVVRYGMDSWSDLFTARQLTTLGVFSELVADVRKQILRDAVDAGLVDDGVRLRDGGSQAPAYADAVVTYLAFVVDKLADFSSNACSWNAPNSQLRYVFSRQAIAMTWDFAEVNPFSGRMASWDAHLNGVVAAIRDCLGGGEAAGHILQMDARALIETHGSVAVSTDPPYYDNICYADLSDFFFVWLRRNLSDIWPDECGTLLTPKTQELIANPYRAGSKTKAKTHFETGMAEVMTQVRRSQRMDVPATIYYAYKATETKDGGVRSTGWDTFLQGVVDAGLQVTATWPLRTERQGRLISVGANALASSIVLACRPRDSSARLATRGEFIRSLRDELPDALRVLQSGNIAPVDVAQSTIGPGIKVFSRYAKVVEADGSSMKVADALAIINEVLGEVLDGEEAELDADTRFASSWYAQHGYKPSTSGDADGQARAKNTSLKGIEDAGIGEARGGQFRLFERTELNPDWDPVSDDRRTVWEATQYLVAALERSETEASELLHRMGGYADRARQLAYVLFQKATDKGWAEEAGAYNGLITAWPALQAIDVGGSGQQSLL